MLETDMLRFDVGMVQVAAPPLLYGAFWIQIKTVEH